MNAGTLAYFLDCFRLETVTDPVTGETTREWTEAGTVRADRIKLNGRAVMSGRESTVKADAAYYVRIQHHITDGWRVRERGGYLYDVTVEPNRQKGLKLLKCTKVND